MSTSDPPEVRPGLAPRLPAHIPSLDGLRAVSIIFVTIAHLSATEGRERFNFLLPFGNLGVKIFFEISGFLITALLLKEMSSTGSVSLRGFYWRRVLRIFPAFYAYIGIIGAISLFGVIRLLPGDLIHALTFTMNYHHARAWYLNHLWSLSVEEQFYLIWPALLCWAGARRSVRLLVGVIVAAPLIRLAMVMHGSHLSALTREFQAIADALAAGCLLAVCFNWLGARQKYIAFLKSPLFLPAMAGGLALPLVLYKINQSLFYTVGQSLSHLCIAMCIERCVRMPAGIIGAVLNSRPLVFIGALSYSLYLWQEPFLSPYVAGTARPRVTIFPYNIACLVLAALASYYLIERPFLKLKNRSKHAQAPVANAAELTERHPDPSIAASHH